MRTIVIFFFTGNTIDAAITLAMTNMKKVTQSFHCNRLSLNVNKTKYLIFNHNIPRIIEDQPPNLLIDSLKIEQVNSAIFLGFTIQSNLKWDEHIHNICKKISTGIGIMKKLRKYLPTTCLFTIYYSHIYPLIIRGIFVWGQTTKSNQSRLRILQKRSLRIINNSPSRASAKELFIKYKIFPFQKLYTQQLLLHMYKVHHNTIPTMYEEFYQKKHTRIIRNTDKYVIPKYLNPLMEKTFFSTST